MARLRKIWLLISLAGTVLTVVGILGLAAHWGTTAATARAVARSPIASPTPTIKAETPSAFFALFTTAVRRGDTSFLASRVAPVVIARYGMAQCRSEVGLLSDPTQQLHLVSTSGPIQYSYVSDGRSSTVANTFVFHVDGTAAGRTGPRDYHFALVDGTFHLLLDCGTPLRSS